jgi:hypothetical protein
VALIWLGLSNGALAVMINDTNSGALNGANAGNIDTFLTATDTLANSNPTTEEAFVDQYLIGMGLDPVNFITKIENDPPIYNTDAAGVYAANITTNTNAVADYFIVKNSTWWALFENLVDLNWAVFDSADLPAGMNIPGSFTISHITLFDATSVPEPSILALLGLSLLGLGFSRRKTLHS